MSISDETIDLEQEANRIVQQFLGNPNGAMLYINMLNLLPVTKQLLKKRVLQLFNELEERARQRRESEQLSMPDPVIPTPVKEKEEDKAKVMRPGD
jgi:hypothetical protein